MSHIATHLHERDFSTVIHDFSVRIPASYRTVKRHDGGKLRLFSRFSLNIKIADKGKEMNLRLDRLNLIFLIIALQITFKTSNLFILDK